MWTPRPNKPGSSAPRLNGIAWAPPDRLSRACRLKKTGNGSPRLANWEMGNPRTTGGPKWRHFSGNVVRYFDWLGTQSIRRQRIRAHVIEAAAACNPRA